MALSQVKAQKNRNDWYFWKLQKLKASVIIIFKIKTYNNLIKNESQTVQ